MKNLFAILLALSCVLIVSSCKKDDGGGNNNGTAPAPGDCTASPYRIGSVVTYSAAAGGTYKQTITKDTIIGGNTYLKGVNSLAPSLFACLRIAANGDVYQLTPSVGDIPSLEMIYYKQNQAVGASWYYNVASLLAPSLITYKYTHTVLANNISFTLGGKTYTNCMKVKLSLDTYVAGTLSASSTTTSTWACGLGIVTTEANGAPYTTLIDYVY